MFILLIRYSNSSIKELKNYLSDKILGTHARACLEESPHKNSSHTLVFDWNYVATLVLKKTLLPFVILLRSSV